MLGKSLPDGPSFLGSQIQRNFLFIFIGLSNSGSDFFIDDSKVLGDLLSDQLDH